MKKTVSRLPKEKKRYLTASIHNNINLSLESTIISNCMTREVKTSQSTTPLFQICQIMKN